MNNNLIQVDEFDLAAIRAAFREGRLYIRPAVRTALELREDGIRAIMEYVSRIDECASGQYHACVHSIWSQLLHDEDLQPLCFMTKGKRQGQPNWYRITSIVCVMREWNIYRNREFSAVDLHLRLEGVSKRNNIYVSAPHYCLEHRDIVRLRKIVQFFNNLQE